MGFMTDSKIKYEMAKKIRTLSLGCRVGHIYMATGSLGVQKFPVFDVFYNNFYTRTPNDTKPDR